MIFLCFLCWWLFLLVVSGWGCWIAAGGGLARRDARRDARRTKLTRRDARWGARQEQVCPAAAFQDARREQQLVH